MQNKERKDKGTLTDPALGAGKPSERTAPRRAPRTKPVPDSSGPTPPSRAGKKRRSTGNSGFLAFFRDYRTQLAVGLILCTVALIMAVTTISFIFNAAHDQSIIHGRGVQDIVDSGEKVDTAGGILGAKVAEFLLVNTFGIASFILVFYLFLLGLACMRVRRTHFFALTFRSLFATAALSVIFGFFTYDSSTLFRLGGSHGYYINHIVLTYTDTLGAYGLTVLLAGLLVAVFFNPVKATCSFIGKAVSGLFGTSRSKQAAPEENDGSADTDDSPMSAFENKEEEDFADSHLTDGGDSDDLPEDDAEEEPGHIGVDIFNDQKDDTQEKENAEEEIPADPELIIVNNRVEDTASDEDKTTIRHGDHIGLDKPFDIHAEHSRYVFPPLDLLVDRPKTFEIDDAEQAANKQLIVQALKSYNIDIIRIEATIGPTVTLYEIVPSQGTRIAKIKSLEDDIAMSLSALGIRIIAPIPGKGTIGIEVPNSKPQIVSMRTILESRKFRDSKMKLPMALGQTISNEIYMADLTKMPHLLVAGATGQGKSVGLNCIITSLLYSKHPDELKFVLIDPKMVEFSLYRTIDRQYLAKIPDEENAVITDPNKVIATLNSLCVEMDQRYELLQSARVRGIEDYNQRFVERRLNPEEGHRFLPYIVMIVDEYADLVMVAGKEIQQPICRIAQKARAVGMHMIIATQRPSTDVITGMIKANFPARIAFKVTQGIDSKTILDRTGAQRLIGRGDMLILINGIVERVQCALVDTPEVDAICNHIGSQPGFTGCYLLPEPPAEDGGGEMSGADVPINDEFRKCAMFIAAQDSASITSLQRNFSIGFNKAGRYMDQMQRLGIVGQANGSKTRQVLMSPDQVERLLQ